MDIEHACIRVCGRDEPHAFRTMKIGTMHYSVPILIRFSGRLIKARQRIEMFALDRIVFR